MTPVFDWNPAARRIVWANAEALAFWGATSLAELRARPFSSTEDAARVLCRQSELLNESGIGEDWLILAPGADPLLCKAIRSHRAAGAPDKGGEARMVRLELREILDPEGNDFARALAAFENGPTAQIVSSPSGEILLRNEADRHLFGTDLPDLSARFREPTEARRALRTADAAGGFALNSELATVFGAQNFQIAMRRFRDPATGDPAILCAFGEVPQVDAEERARVAHDLRSPLNAIQGFAEYMDLASDNLTAAERSAYLGDIQSACAAMLTLIETLVEDAAPAPEMASEEVFDLYPVAEAVTRLHRQRARRAGGDLVLAIEDAGQVRGDADAARRIIDNLVDNAIRHGGAQLAVAIRKSEIVVSDRGAGDGAPPVLSRVGAFGLRNCHDLAAQMGATLTIGPNDGGGVTARLAFAATD